MIVQQSTTSRDTHKQPRIVLAHDWLTGLRGGELVLDRLARLYGPTTIHTLVSNGKPLTEAIDQCEVRTSPLQRLPGASDKLRRWYLPFMPWAVERLRVEECDLLVSTSSAVIKSIVPPRSTPHLCYCHSPARYIWEQGHDYAHGSRGRLRSTGLALIRSRFQRWDRATASRVTRFLANSCHTAARIRRCYNRDASVVYPPVRTNVFTHDASIAREDWLLVVSALEPYKRVDLVINAAASTERPLKIIGDGSQYESLRTLAKNASVNIEFLGRVPDETVLDHYRRAAALVFPQVEDFGITAVEAQATGCPIIAFAAGGALETVSERTGVLFDQQSVEALAEAITRMFADSNQIDPQDCRKNAEQFSEEVFDAAIQRHVLDLLSLH